MPHQLVQKLQHKMHMKGSDIHLFFTRERQDRPLQNKICNNKLEYKFTTIRTAITYCGNA